MKKSICANLHKHSVLYFVVILSMFSFILLYGVHVINPTYVDWLLQGGDLSQHYLGWKAFRNGAWQWPIGLTDRLSYPYANSIIFTDSIPVFAVLFKCFANLLPENFQYFGMWGITCFALQGLFAAILIKKYTQSKWTIIIGSELFVLSPVVIQRMFGHTALAGHWIILLSLISITYYETRFSDDFSAMRFWAILGGLAASIHIYFLPMCGLILVGYCICDLLATKKVKRSIYVLLSYILCALLTVYLLGGFIPGLHAEEGGLGYYSFNLNSFFNPLSWSKIFRDLPVCTDKYEGFSYLGAGIILLLTFSLVTLFGKASRDYFTNHLKTIIALGFVLAVCIMIAMSNKISLNDKLIFEYQLPAFIMKLWNVFRASGRFIWPAFYILLLFAIIIATCFVNRKTVICLLSICLAIQIYDISDVLLSKNRRFNTKITYQSPLKNDDWNTLFSSSEIKHILFCADFQAETDIYFAFADAAMSNNKTLNNFYFARSFGELIHDNVNASLSEPDDSMLFIFKNNGAILQHSNLKLHFYPLDDFIVGSSKILPINEPEISSDIFSKFRYEFNNQYVSNGEDKDGQRFLYTNGLSFGPYITAMSGKYEVNVKGQNLNGAILRCYFDHGKSSKIHIEEKQRTDAQIQFDFILDEPVEDLEVCIENPTSTTMIIEQFFIELQGDDIHE